MLWLTVRQQRGRLLLLASLIGIVIGILLITGLRVHQLYDQSGLAACLRAHADVNSCAGESDSFLLSPDSLRAVQATFPYLYALPFLFGALISAPMMANEFEQGMHKFAWTQGMTRRRWFWTQVGILFVILLALMGLLSLLVAWWNQPYLALDGPLPQPNYDFLGVVPLAFSAFGFALGLAAGAMLRRVILAVATTFLYLPVWQGVDTIARGSLIPPITVYFPMTGVPPDLSRQDWILSVGYIDPSGVQSTVLSVPPSCAPASIQGSGIGAALMRCLSSQGYRQFLTYQPVSRFWPLQTLEGGLLLLLALLLLGVAFWTIQRRVV